MWSFDHSFKALQLFLQLSDLPVSFSNGALQVLYSACSFLATHYRCGFRGVLHFQHKTSHILHEVFLRLEGFLGGSLSIRPARLHSYLSLYPSNHTLKSGFVRLVAPRPSA